MKDDLIYEAVHPTTGAKVNVLAMTSDGFARMSHDDQLAWVEEHGWPRTGDSIEDAHAGIMKYESKIESRCQHLAVGDTLFFW